MSLPYFPLYPKDFEAKTSHLSMLEDGAYNRLLRLCWMTPGCSLPDDEAWIMRRMRASGPDEVAAVKAVLSEFFTQDEGRVFQGRLREEALLAEEAHARRVEAGRRGGRKVKVLENNKTEQSNAKAMLKQPEPEPEYTLEPNGSNGADAPIDPAKVMFDAGRKMLTDAGKSRDQAGKILGKWRNDHGTEAVIAALGRAQREGAIDPVAFVEGVLKFTARQRQRSGPMHGEERTTTDGRRQVYHQFNGWETVHV